MPDRVQEMVRMYVEDGRSYAQIGDHFGLTRQRVHQLIGQLVGDVRRPERRQAAKEQELVAAHRRVMKGQSTLGQEAEKLGYASVASIRGVMAKRGLLFAGRPRPSHRVFAPHGTVERYRQECRCKRCRTANTEHNRELRKRGEAPTHGTESGYRNYGCKCRPCLEAGRKAQRARKAARRRRKTVPA